MKASEFISLLFWRKKKKIIFKIMKVNIVNDDDNYEDNNIKNKYSLY